MHVIIRSAFVSTTAGPREKNEENNCAFEEHCVEKRLILKKAELILFG